MAIITTNPPTALPNCPGYLYGQVFNCGEVREGGTGTLYILYFDEDQYWVGGHQEEPEPVEFPEFTVTGFSPYFSIWADSLGWTASRVNAGGSDICSVSSDGTSFSSPTVPDNRFLSADGLNPLSGGLGNGNFLLRDRSSGQFEGFGNAYIWSEGEWTFERSNFTPPDTSLYSYGFSIGLPLVKFSGSPAISRTNSFAVPRIGSSGSSDASYSNIWAVIGIDRGSAILEYIGEDYISGIYSGYFELVSSDDQPKEFLSYSYNSATEVGELPEYLYGTYTDGVFTFGEFQAVNAMKTEAGTVEFLTTSFDWANPGDVKVIRTRSETDGFKIPDTANILAWCFASTGV